jgi:hypothetical protein
VRFLNTFWGSLVMLILVMLVLEHYVGVSSLLGSGSKAVGSIVTDFKT